MTGATGRKLAGVVATVVGGVALIAACRVAGPITAPPLPTPAPHLAPTQVPSPAPRVPTPLPTPATSLLPPEIAIRVLVAEGEPLVLPDPGRRYRCVADGAETELRGPITAERTVFRPSIQVGAYASEANAQRETERLAALGLEVTANPGGGGLYRVFVVGRDGESGESLAHRVASAGITDRGPITSHVGRVKVLGEDGRPVEGTAIRLAPLNSDPVRVGGRRYRGELVLLPVATGVRLITVLPLEEYLRGVVPAEMGPRAFPALEALKAQAVAARTYAVAHLGEHAAEGYDICSTQACQVYEGVGAEHPLTDRAITETGGEIAVWNGEPIDAMYHSTCAGHTEDAAALLPERAAPYLVGVPCRGEGELRLGAGTSPGPWMSAVDRLVLVGRHLGRTVGLESADATSFARTFAQRPSVGGVRGLVLAFNLGNAVTMLHGVDDLDLTGKVVRLLETFRIPLGPRQEGVVEDRWELALAVRLAQLAGAIEGVEGRLIPSPTGARLVVDRGEDHRELTGTEQILERRLETFRTASVTASAGSDATLWCVRGGACPVLEVEPRPEADDRSAWGWWVREVPLAEISVRLGVSGVSDVAVLRRGRSGRALAVALKTGNGVREVGGFRFRMSLGLPDTLFQVSLREGGDGPLARFVGRGWGHGIGMCQNGAFGLAQGGATYDEILSTYYTGIELVRGGDR